MGQIVGSSVIRKVAEIEARLPAAEQPIASVVHDHDDRYYLQSTLDSLLAEKAGVSHNHDGVYSPEGHNHDASYYTKAQTYTQAEVNAALAAAGGLTLAQVVNALYPVGRVIITTAAEDPNVQFPGTAWTAFAAGRVLVGLDAAQTEFDAVGKTGGAKTHAITVNELPPHNHPITSQTATTGTATSYEHGALDTSSTEAEVTEVTGNTGGGAAHNNLQPYEVVRYWRRTA